MTPDTLTDKPSDYAVREIRAEMARQHKRVADLARILDGSLATATRRLNGRIPFSLNELADVAGWLRVPVTNFVPAKPTKVA